MIIIKNLIASRACIHRALRDRSYILQIHLSLFLVIWYWSLSQFYNIVIVDYILSKLLNLFLISNEKGNSIYLRGSATFSIFVFLLQTFHLIFIMFSAFI